MDLPYLSLCMPIYNRNKFTRLIISNLMRLDYPKENHYKTKRSIGDKRNNLVKIAKHKIIGFMDSDDLYLSDYLKYSVNMLKTEKKGLVGSNQMLFLFPPENFEDKWLLTGIKCSTTRMIHEASMVFTKKLI